MKEQLKLMKDIREKANVNIVNCGNCGDVLLHELNATKIDCCHCGFSSEPCDFPDFY